MDSAENNDASASHQFQQLQEQNQTLKTVIHHMRQDMEQLSNQVANKDTGDNMTETGIDQIANRNTEDASKEAGVSRHQPISEEGKTFPFGQ